MKKFRLKKWVENLLLAIEAVLFCALLFIVESNSIALICNKLIGAGLFLVIGSVLLEYGNIDKED